MKAAKVLVYDGSFNGFLTVVYTAFNEKLVLHDIQRKERSQNKLFSESFEVETNKAQARRVWDAVLRKNQATLRMIYFAFLSEYSGVELLLYNYIRNIFKKNDEGIPLLSEAEILKIKQLSEAVAREKYKHENGLKFSKEQNHTLSAMISPEFNVLPLVSKYFRSKFPTNSWTIYDLKRKYGISFNGSETSLVNWDSDILPSKTAASQDREVWNARFGKRSGVGLKQNPLGMAV